MAELQRVSKEMATIVMHEAVMSVRSLSAGEELAVDLLNRLSTLGYSLGRREAVAESGEVGDRDLIESLRMLVIVELATASTLERSDYVVARMAGYEFVLDAIERRWPDLGEWRARVAEIAAAHG